MMLTEPSTLTSCLDMNLTCDLLFARRGVPRVTRVLDERGGQWACSDCPAWGCSCRPANGQELCGLSECYFLDLWFISDSQSDFRGAGGWGDSLGSSSFRSNFVRSGVFDSTASAYDDCSRPRAWTGITPPWASSGQLTRTPRKFPAYIGVAPPMTWKNDWQRLTFTLTPFIYPPHPRLALDGPWTRTGTLSDR